MSEVDYTNAKYRVTYDQESSFYRPEVLPEGWSNWHLIDLAHTKWGAKRIIKRFKKYGPPKKIVVWSE